MPLAGGRGCDDEHQGHEEREVTHPDQLDRIGRREQAASTALPITASSCPGSPEPSSRKSSFPASPSSVRSSWARISRSQIGFGEIRARQACLESEAKEVGLTWIEVLNELDAFSGSLERVVAGGEQGFPNGEIVTALKLVGGEDGGPSFRCD